MGSVKSDFRPSSRSAVGGVGRQRGELVEPQRAFASRRLRQLHEGMRRQIPRQLRAEIFGHFPELRAREYVQ